MDLFIAILFFLVYQKVLFLMFHCKQFFYCLTLDIVSLYYIFLAGPISLSIVDVIFVDR